MAGNEVVVKFLNLLHKMQVDHGGWKEAMKECFVGPCKLILLSDVDAVVETPSRQLYRLNPQLLSKYHQAGDLTLLTSDELVLRAGLEGNYTLGVLVSLLGQPVELLQKHQDDKWTVKYQSKEYTLHEDCLMSSGVASNSSSSTITAETSLHIAIQARDDRLCRFLINDGARVDVKNKEQLTPIMLATQIGYEEVLTPLVQRPDAKLNIGDDNDNTALHLAVLNSQVNSAKILLEAGANIRAINKDKFTPFHLAAFRGHERILELFLDKHGQSLVNLQKEDRFTALHLVTLNHHTACLRLLIGRNADLKVGNDIMQTPLHLAVSVKNMETVKILVESGAEVDLQDEDGQTPLHYAIRSHNSERGTNNASIGSDNPEDIAIYLVEHGASVYTCNSGGEFLLTMCEDQSLRERLRNIHSKNLTRWLVTAQEQGDEPGGLGMDELHGTIQNVLNEKMCKICMYNDTKVVFNCGHSACHLCVNILHFCHVCRRRIVKTLRIY